MAQTIINFTDTAFLGHLGSIHLFHPYDDPLDNKSGIGLDRRNPLWRTARNPMLPLPEICQVGQKKNLSSRSGQMYFVVTPYKFTPQKSCEDFWGVVYYTYNGTALLFYLSIVYCVG